MKDLLNRTISIGDTVYYLTTKQIKVVSYVTTDHTFPYLKLIDCIASKVKPTSVIVIDAQLLNNKQCYPENFI